MLEILIPTYMRPESAAEAIDICLMVKDARLTVLCHSNGYEKNLEKYRNIDPRVRYSSFPENRGVLENFKWLFESAQAKYCMLLSDEDRIDVKGIVDYINFLETIGDVSAVVCSIYDSEQKNWFYHYPGFQGKKFKIQNFISHRMPVPWYMSGMTYCKKDISNNNILEKVFIDSKANVYPHIDILLYLLNTGSSMSYYSGRSVIKGREIHFGGDGYSHLKKPDYSSTGHPNLNPEIYGPLAAVRQYFYRDQLLGSLNLTPLLRVQALLLNLRTYLHFLNDSQEMVLISDLDKIKEVKFGVEEFKAGCSESSSFVSFIFSVCIKYYVSGPLLFRIGFRRLTSGLCHALHFINRYYFR